MKATTSFAILSLLASMGTTFGAPIKTNDIKDVVEHKVGHNVDHMSSEKPQIAIDGKVHVKARHDKMEHEGLDVHTPLHHQGKEGKHGHGVEKVAGMIPVHKDHHKLPRNDKHAPVVVDAQVGLHGNEMKKEDNPFHLLGEAVFKQKIPRNGPTPIIIDGHVEAQIGVHHVHHGKAMKIEDPIHVIGNPASKIKTRRNGSLKEELQDHKDVLDKSKNGIVHNLIQQFEKDTEGKSKEHDHHNIAHISLDPKVSIGGDSPTKNQHHHHNRRSRNPFIVNSSSKSRRDLVNLFPSSSPGPKAGIVDGYIPGGDAHIIQTPGPDKTIVDVNAGKEDVKVNLPVDGPGLGEEQVKKFGDNQSSNQKQQKQQSGSGSGEGGIPEDEIAGIRKGAAAFRAPGQIPPKNPEGMEVTVGNEKQHNDHPSNPSQSHSSVHPTQSQSHSSAHPTQSHSSAHSTQSHSSAHPTQSHSSSASTHPTQSHSQSQSHSSVHPKPSSSSPHPTSSSNPSPPKPKPSQEIDNDHLADIHLSPEAGTLDATKSKPPKTDHIPSSGLGSGVLQIDLGHNALGSALGHGELDHPSILGDTHLPGSGSKPAKINAGQVPKNTVPCDGVNVRDGMDLVDMCIEADLLPQKPDGYVVCPDEYQHDIHINFTGESLDSKLSKEVAKYVRLCLDAGAL